MYYLFDSDSTDAVKLNNTWGDFNKVINYIIDGTSGLTYNISSFVYYTDNKVKVSFENNAKPFVRYQTITIKSDTYQFDFFIDKIETKGVYILYNKDITNTQINNFGSSLTCSIVKSGLTRVFGGVTDNRTVFKTSNGMQFRIDDRNYGDKTIFPQSTATFYTNYPKLCRVSMCKSYTSLDSTESRIYPYIETRPTENFEVIGNYIGQTYIYYNYNFSSSRNNYIFPTTGDYAANNTKYRIYANNKCIIILLYNNLMNSNLKNTMCYIFGEYINNFDTISGYMQCSKTLNLNSPYNDQSGNFNVNVMDGSSPNQSTFPSTTQGGNCICKTVYNYNNSTLGINFRPEFGVYNSGSGTGPISYPSGDNKLYTSDVLLFGNDNIIGKFYNIKWVHNNIYGNIVGPPLDDDKLVSIDNKIYIVQTNNPNGSGGTSNLSKFLVELLR